MPLLRRRARDLFKQRRHATRGHLNIEEHKPLPPPPPSIGRHHIPTSLTQNQAVIGPLGPVEMPVFRVSAHSDQRRARTCGGRVLGGSGENWTL